MSKAPMIGIDLGTCNSKIAVYQNGKVELIPSDIGENSLPSYIAFTGNKKLFGTSARNQMKNNPNNTLFNIKRLISLKFNQKELNEQIKFFPFKVSQDNHTQKLQIELTNNKKLFIEEILALELQKIRQIASNYTKKEIKCAVVGVPNCFFLEQRELIKDAGKIAGFDFIKVVGEPILASFVYELNEPQNKDKKEENIFIFDLGGGYLKTTLMNLEDGLLEVKSVNDLPNIGGEDFDNRLIEYCSNEFKRINNIDLMNNPKALIRLRKECEKAKKNLSSSKKYVIEIEEIINGIDLNIEITRDKFEELCDDLFQKIIPVIEQLLKEGEIKKEQVDEIFLIGGSSRIPKIQTMIKDFFNGKQINKTLNQDEAIACGAAIQGEIMTNVKDENLEKIILLDIIPFSLGIENEKGEMEVIVKKNSTVPCKKTIMFPTYEDNQKEIIIKLYEGENKLTNDNNLIGLIKLGDLPPKQKGQIDIEITLDIDALYNINLEVLEKTSGKKNKMWINYNNYRLDENYMKKLISDYQKENENEKKILNIESKIEEIFDWIKNNKNASNDDIDIKKEELINNIENQIKGDI